MKSIISVNNKFMDFSPQELINIVKENSKYIDGFEIYIEYHNKNEIEYLKELANLCKKYNLHFQVHGSSYLTINENINYMKMLEEISDYLGYRINVTLHSVKADTNQESVILTTNYLDEIISNIDNSKIKICLENLNDIPGEDRLNIEDITPIVCNNENLYLTFDIGHELVEYYNVTYINETVMPLVANIHLHTMDYEYDISQGFDHKAIFKNDPNWNIIIKRLIYLKNNNYNDSITYEYDLFTCPGDTLKDKIISYCKSIDYVSERYK